MIGFFLKKHNISMLALIDTYRFVVKRWCYFVYTLCKFLRGCYRFSVASFVDENVLNVFHFTSPHTLCFVIHTCQFGDMSSGRCLINAMMHLLRVLYLISLYLVTQDFAPLFVGF